VDRGVAHNPSDPNSRRDAPRLGVTPIDDDRGKANDETRPAKAPNPDGIKPVLGDGESNTHLLHRAHPRRRRAWSGYTGGGGDNVGRPHFAGFDSSGERRAQCGSA